MAGKFLSLEEAAERLGVSVDEVHRLVDRKQLYPMRDGNTLKFKPDEIERLATADEGSQGAGESGLALDLDDLSIEPAQAPSADAVGSVKLSGSLDLGDSLKLGAGDSANATGSGGPPLSGSAAPATGLSLGDGLVLDDDLVVADAISASSAIPTPKQPAAPVPPAEPVTGTLPIDLSEIDLGGTGSNATGSLVAASGPDAVSLSGAMSSVGPALSGLEGGLSLEDSDVRKSGILSAGSGLSGASAAAQSGLAGEEFEEFDPVPDDDSGSDIVAEGSEAASSSFLDDDGSSSVFPGDGSSSIAAAAADDVMGDFEHGVDLVRDTSFSVWQICGLVCCALLMLTGGFVMFDLIRTLGSPDDLTLSSPLLNPMADLFGWRR